MKEGQEANVGQKAAPQSKSETPSLPKVRLFLESLGISWEAATLILISLGVLACAGLVTVAIGWHRSARENSEQQASRLLLQANSSAGVNELLTKYPSCKIKPVALLRLAQFQQADGNYTLAQDTYGQFLKEYPNHPLQSTAELGKTICVESAGNADQAIRDYDEFMARRPNDVLCSEAIFGKARCMERLGRLDEARQVYEDFLASHPESVWKTRAEQALELITKEIKRAAAGPGPNETTTTWKPAGSEVIK